MQKVLGPIRRVRFTQPTLRHASIRKKKRTSLGKMQVKLPHQRSPHLKKRLQDNSDAPEARRGTLPKTYTSSKRTTKVNSTRLRGMGMAGYIKKETEERELVVDSGASMHMVSRKDLNSAELKTMRMSRNPTTVMMANGEVLTREEATVYVKQLDLFVKILFLEEILQFFLRGNSVRIVGTHTSGSVVRPHLLRNSVVMSTDTSKIPVQERSGTTSGELRGTRNMNPQKPKTKKK